MVANVKFEGTPPVVVRTGMSWRAGMRMFGCGTVIGAGSGFVAGFALAQAIYSDEEERKQVKRTVKITACAAAAPSSSASSARSSPDRAGNAPSGDVSSRASCIPRARWNRLATRLSLVGCGLELPTHMLATEGVW
eukprot:CAMPEP_0197415930 /NCGR_PEP_ID=MMETSP1170-20131217/2354_1 /TAXON_ID=54406 /ORGANISM="Sarcinochrysis sp, Strain CCMP770" /LENGTH=135 /DNA_ID=CAMNT_0042942785 /DNA_START=32 /DNA_END=437 /DNA_ORIENTATION=-